MVSILIVTYNSAGEVARCLASLRTFLSGVSGQVILVDNASSDDTIAVAQGALAPIKVLAQSSNLGFGRAVNLAANYASGKYLLILNPDTEVFADDALKQMLQLLEARPEVAAAGCRLVDSQRRVQPFAYYLPTLLLLLGQLVGAKHVLRLPVLGRMVRWFGGGNAISSYTRGLEFSEPCQQVEVLSGACVLVRAEVFKGLGGFDQNIFLYMEDTDLFCRMHEAGLGVALVSSLGVEHTGGSSFKAAFSSISPRKYWSTLYYVDKHHSALGYLCVRVVLLASTLAKAARNFYRPKYCKDCVDIFRLCLLGYKHWSPFPK